MNIITRLHPFYWSTQPERYTDFLTDCTEQIMGRNKKKKQKSHGNKNYFH